MYEHNALGYWSGLALCLTKVRSSRARCPATALIYFFLIFAQNIDCGYTLHCGYLLRGFLREPTIYVLEQK